MSAQNRAASDISSPSETAAANDSTSKNPDADVDGAETNSKALPSPSTDSPQDQRGKYSDGEGGTTSSQSSGEKDEYIIVKLADIRKEVQCPICLGIIRKTRTVMECLHRFCRECIDKSMRLGNNECPACRTHLASRRSLRDDPNYDALIAALYPDIDKYEEEELAFHEEERNRNKKIQASIAETLRRQSEALGRRRPTAKATAAAFMRRSHGNYCTVQNSYFRCRGRPAAHNASPAVSNDDEEEDVSSNDAGKDSSSVEEASPDRRPKKRRMLAPKSSPARFNGNVDLGCDENYDLELNRENFRTAPLRAGNRELAWGKGGVRSQSRHGNSSSSNGRLVKAARLTKLIEYLHNLDENEDKFDVHLTLLPLNEQSLPLESPYVCCPSGLSIRYIQQVNIASNPSSDNHFNFKLEEDSSLTHVHIYELLQFIAIQISVQYEGIDIFVRKPRSGTDKPSDQAKKVQVDPSEEMLILGAEESLAGLLSSFTFSQGGLELLYRANVRKES